MSHREFYWTEYIIPNFRALNGLKNANWPKIGSGSSAVGEERVTSPKNVWVEGYKSTKEEPLSRNGTAILDRSAPPTNAGRIQIWSDPMYSVFLPNDRWIRKERVSSASHRSWPLGAFARGGCIHRLRVSRTSLILEFGKSNEPLIFILKDTEPLLWPTRFLRLFSFHGIFCFVTLFSGEFYNILDSIV